MAQGARNKARWIWQNSWVERGKRLSTVMWGSEQWWEWRRRRRKEDPDPTELGSSTRTQAPCQLLQLFSHIGASHNFDNCPSLSVLMPHSSQGLQVSHVSDSPCYENSFPRCKSQVVTAPKMFPPLVVLAGEYSFLQLAKLVGGCAHYLACHTSLKRPFVLFWAIMKHSLWLMRITS